VLGRWGARHPGHRPDLPISIASFVLSLRTNADPSKLAGLDLVVAVEIGGEPFVAMVCDDEFSVERGTSPYVTASVAGPPEALAAAVYGGVDPSHLGLPESGDPAALRTLLGVSTLPAKAF